MDTLTELKDSFRSFIRRVLGSALLWSWGMNALRIGATLILLPLLLRHLAPAELGIHYLLTSLMVLAPLLDFGFSNALWRAVAHAQTGGRELPTEGLADAPAADSPANHTLQWHLLHTARHTCARLAWIAAPVLALGGSVAVAARIAEVPAPTQAWAALALTWLTAVAEVHTGWWGMFLLGLNRPVDYARCNLIGYALRLALAALLLWLGAGVVSVPAAALAGVAVQRALMRRECRRHLPMPEPASERSVVRMLAERLWPNARRMGAVSLSGFLGTQALLLISLACFGLTATGQFGLSLQLMTVSQGMAAVWVNVKWPELAQRRTRGDLAGLRTLMRRRLWPALLTCAALSGGAMLLAPPLLAWFAPDKAALPAAWLAVMAVTALLELHLSFWGVFLFAGNQVPYVWPVVGSNVASLLLAAWLATHSPLGLGALALAPLLVGLAFNYWHWPRVGAAQLGVTWPRLMLARTPA